MQMPQSAPPLLSRPKDTSPAALRAALNWDGFNSSPDAAKHSTACCEREAVMRDPATLKGTWQKKLNKVAAAHHGQERGRVQALCSNRFKRTVSCRRRHHCSLAAAEVMNFNVSAFELYVPHRYHDAFSGEAPSESGRKKLWLFIPRASRQGRSVFDTSTSYSHTAC